MKDITIRVARVDDAAEIANVHINSWREAYRNLVPQGFLDEKPLEFKNRYELWKRVIPSEGNTTFVADSKDHGIVGFVNGVVASDGPHKGSVEVLCIYLLKKYHHKKVGFGLLKSFFDAYRKLGFDKAFLWVLADNPTSSFYERAGGKFTGESKKDDIGGQSVTELCYGWNSLNL